MKNISVDDPDLVIEAEKEVAKGSYPNRDEMIELNLRRLNGDEEAKNEMITRNEGLVLSFVSRRKNQWEPDYDDWLQAGRKGLMKAVEKFNHTLGFAFSTYAYWWIRQSVYRQNDEESRTIRLPVHVVAEVRRLRRIANLVSQRLGRMPTVDEISEESGVSIDKLNELFSYFSTTTSLDQSINEDEHDNLHHAVPDHSTPRADTVLAAVDESAEALKWAKNLREHLEDSFSPQQKHVFFTRFGLFSGSFRKTLEETGRIFGISRERVRQICFRIFKKRASLRLPIANEEELNNLIHCLEIGLEAKFAYTGKLDPEIIRVIGGLEKRVAEENQSHLRRWPKKKKTISPKEIVFRLRSLVEKHIPNQQSAAHAVVFLAREDFNIPTKISLTALQLKAGSESLQPVLDDYLIAKVRASYNLDLLGQDISEVWKRQGKLFPSQVIEARKMQSGLKKKLKKAEGAFLKDRSLPVEAKEAMLSLYGLGKKKKGHQEELLALADTHDHEFMILIARAWDILEKQHDLEIRSDEDYQKAKREFSLLEMLLK